MAINFNQDSTFNLVPIKLDNVLKSIDGLLIGTEKPVMAFQTLRDQMIFTTMRIIAVDVQGITGRRKSFTSMPYSRIQYFTIQTPGFLELISDSELIVAFSNGFTAHFEFSGNTDIGLIGRVISQAILTSQN